MSIFNVQKGQNIECANPDSKSYSNYSSFMKRNLLGVDVSDITREEVLEYIVKGLQQHSKKYYIVTPNPEIIVIAQRDNKYKDVLNRAKLALPDGIGILLAAKFLGLNLKERITGVGLLDSICQAAAKQPITVGFLGGGEGVAVKAAECLKKKYPSLKIALASSNLKFKISNLKLPPDILFVAFGAPKQEFWISENLDKIPVKVAIGVGGAFDFISGNVRRAPKFLRLIGLEWLFRLALEPWRIKRQLSLFTFVFLIIKEKFSAKGGSSSGRKI